MACGTLLSMKHILASNKTLVLNDDSIFVKLNEVKCWSPYARAYARDIIGGQVNRRERWPKQRRNNNNNNKSRYAKTRVIGNLLKQKKFKATEQKEKTKRRAQVNGGGLQFAFRFSRLQSLNAPMPGRSSLAYWLRYPFNATARWSFCVCLFWADYDVVQILSLSYEWSARWYWKRNPPLIVISWHTLCIVDIVRFMCLSLVWNRKTSIISTTLLLFAYVACACALLCLETISQQNANSEIRIHFWREQTIAYLLYRVHDFYWWTSWLGIAEETAYLVGAVIV